MKIVSLSLKWIPGRTIRFRGNPGDVFKYHKCKPEEWSVACSLALTSQFRLVKLITGTNEKIQYKRMR